MGDHDGLCNVTRYTNLLYAERVPAPLSEVTTANNPLTESLIPDQDVYHTVDKTAILNLRDHISHLRAGIVNVPVSPNSPNSPVSDGPTTATDVIPDDAVACRQKLVDAFLAEGMPEVNDGQTYSGYPLYGRKSAMERLEAVRRVLHENLQVDVQLPRTVAGAETVITETREQYWRRLARLYIQKGEDISTRTAAVLGSAPFEPEDPFYMIDLGRVVEQMALWRHCLPMVRPHFAVKCNPSLPIMQVLAALGAGFDCASKAEISLVLDNNLVDSPNDIIFANPCKQPGDLKAASAAGVFYTTFDNEQELEKLAHYMPNARAVIRIATNDSSAKCAFSTKFGARLDKVPALLARAAALHVDIYGVSFHVGSGNNDPRAYVSAIEAAHHVFEEAARHGFNCTLLDIGGGYPGTRRLSTATSEDDSDEGLAFESIATAIRPVLERLFPSTTIISEPGRYFTAATHAVAMNVFAKRTLRLSEPERDRFTAHNPTVTAGLEAEEAAPLPRDDDRTRAMTSAHHSINGSLAGTADSAAALISGAQDYNDDEAAVTHQNGAHDDDVDAEENGGEPRQVSWEEHQYYVNDGLYHSFNCIVFDHAHPRLWLLDDADGADRLAQRRAEDPAENYISAEELAAQAAEARATLSAAVATPTTAAPAKRSRIVVTTTTVATDSESDTHSVDDQPHDDHDDHDRDDDVAAESTAAMQAQLAAAVADVPEDEAFFSMQQSFTGDSFAVHAAQWARQADVEALTRRRECAPRPLRVSTIFGPTCDSLDCILKQQPFPEMHVGDWLLAPDMGSYTTAAGCPFNGFATRRRELICSVKLL